MTHDDIKKTQDDFLIELNQLVGIPDHTCYDKSRQLIYVNEATMDRMEKRAYEYRDFIRKIFEGFLIGNHRIYNENWGFDVISKYYRVQK